MARSPIAILGLLVMFFLGSLYLLANRSQSGAYPSAQRSPPSTRGAVTHMVLFQFKDSADAVSIAKITRQMLALKDSCLHPVTRQPYIKSLTGGRDNSIEGLQNGITHAFVAEFETVEERDYYVKSDPMHHDFIDAAGPALKKAIVVDFSDGIW